MTPNIVANELGFLKKIVSVCLLHLCSSVLITRRRTVIKMEEEVGKGVKRSNSETDDQGSCEEVRCEEASNRSEQLEAKRWRSYSDFYNSDTGAIVYFCFRFSFLGLLFILTITGK